MSDKSAKESQIGKVEFEIYLRIVKSGGSNPKAKYISDNFFVILVVFFCNFFTHGNFEITRNLQ